jgi:hypothetical protein
MKRIGLLCGVAALVVFSSHAASACMCMTIGTPQKNLADVQAVFMGKVVASRKHEWTIAVDKVWKGDVQETVLMRDPAAGSSCESKFTQGETYIFFAYTKESRRKTIYHPALCTWTTSLTGRYDGILVSEYVLKELGKGRSPSQQSTGRITIRWTGAAVARLAS